MTIIEYFKGKVGFYVNQGNILSILMDRGYDSNTRPIDLTKREKDLLLADLWVFGSTLQSGSIKRGDFSQTQGDVDSKALLEAANSIYKQYNDDKYNPNLGGKINWIEEYE